MVSDDRPSMSFLSSCVKRGKIEGGSTSVINFGQSPVVYMGSEIIPIWNAACRSTASMSSVELDLHGIPLQTGELTKSES